MNLYSGYLFSAGTTSTAGKPETGILINGKSAAYKEVPGTGINS